MDSRLKKPSFIFECFVEVSKPKDGEEAAVQYLFPKEYELSDDLKKQLPKFAFPTRTPNAREEHFTFVLTDLDSKYMFGFCRYPPRGETAMCFVSDLPWYKVFYRTMDKISDLKLDHQNEVVEPFLCGLREHPIPTPGIDTILSVVPKGVDTGQVYTFPLPNPKKLKEIPTDGNLTQFYTNLHYNVIMHLFANMVFERRIIITSNSLSLLSCTVHGAVLLLYPLHWQHIFIPITPPHLLDYCAAPMPFLMGIHSSYMDLVRRMPMDDVVILDVDESTIESPHVEDLLSMPPDVVSTLKHVLKKQTSAYGDTVTRAFLLAQVAMIGGYRSALKVKQGQVVFDEDQFLKSRPHLEEFLGQLLHFQHFRQFINGRIEKLKNRVPDKDLFDNEVLQYEEELKGTEQIKAAFDKFFSSTKEGGKKLGDKFENFGDKLKKARIVDKSWKSMKKGAKKIHGMMQDQKFGYQGQVVEHPGLISSYDSEKKSLSLPIHKSASEGLIHYGHHSHSSTPPPGTVNKGGKPTRPPPPVIPYNRHMEGKRKLAQSLKLQTTTSLPEVPIGMLLNFTPPETPRSVASADQTSLDRSERASLDSKASTEASVASGENAPGEVVIGNLIDITGGEEHKLDEDEGHESDSTVSTTSSSGVNTDSTPARAWERFDDDDDKIDMKSPSNRPPIPPPRSELFSETSQSSNSLNPFESDLDARPRSPFDDSFSSLVAQTLSDKANVEESLTARTLSTMSKDIFKIIEEEEEEEEAKKNSSPNKDAPVPEPLIPTSSAAMATTNVTTSQARNPPQVSLTIGGVANPMHVSASAQNFPGNHAVQNNQFQIGGYHQQNVYNPHNPFITVDYRGVPLNNLGTRPSGPRSPKCERKWPLFVSSEQGTLVYANNLAGARRLPPQKPEPYSGKMPVAQATKQQHLEQNRNALQALYTSDSGSGALSGKEDKRVSDPLLQRLPSLGAFDPFGDILGDGGMNAYMTKESSSVS